MSFTTVVTSKGQLTIPKDVREKLGLKAGIKIEIYPTKDGRFIGKPKKPSKIFDFLGDLKHLDHHESFSDIKQKTQASAAQEILKKQA